MKRIISFLLALVLCLSLPALVYAEYTNSAAVNYSLENTDRAEETEWHYRITDDGLFQKRLWSITYGYWKTDWITIGYV